MDYIKKRAKSILISIIAFLLVSPSLAADYLFAQNIAVNDKTEEVEANKKPLPSPPVYGMPRTQYNQDMPGRNIAVFTPQKRTKSKKSFSGTLAAADTKMPLMGMILHIEELNARTITNKTGRFNFPELYAESDSNKFIMKITNSEDKNFYRTMEIELNKTGETIEISL